MRLSLRFLIPLLVALSLFAYAAVPLVDMMTTRWFVRDLDIRSNLIANTVQEPLEDMIRSGSPTRILGFFHRLTSDERLYAVGLCLSDDAMPIATGAFPTELRCSALAPYLTVGEHLLRTAKGVVHVAVRPLATDAPDTAELVLVHDMSFIERRSEETRRYLFYFFGALALAVALITVVIAQLSWRGWVAGLRALLRGEGILRPSAGTAPELKPIARDVQALLRELEHQFRPTDESQQRWTQQTLRAVLRGEMRGNDVIIVSNREPYIHVKTPQGVRVQRPASGLVTALEPVMRACSGTWIAHGSGSADRETVDKHDRVAVPPESPAYSIRRVWLSDEETHGYYDGFANEGLWPLCHIAHVRPTFRREDFDQYRAVNEKFADAVVAESHSDDPVVLVQDYHFALLPRMIRRRLPKATIITFWHIPWPNPEAFAICPWRVEVLDGLLGSDIVGFHTQFHVNNFLESVDRFVEARIDRETSAVVCRGMRTAVHRYPISLEWPPAPLAEAVPIDEARERVRVRHNLPRGHKVGIGVDRLDYTKGMIERFSAIARLFERQPEWIGRFTFVQIAAPTRGTIGDYRDYAERVHRQVDEINGRYRDAAHPPIILLHEHHEPDAVYEHLRAADLCFVSSLHDGMNLVAKEYVAAHDDERGVLLLSQFAGASRELPEALIVNPYDADECAAALGVALAMPADEQRERMRLMRNIIREFNVYRWAGRMLLDAAAMRQRKRFRDRVEAPAQ
ncbi:MAG: trehalose-6-phosphate synthase [Burkholderiales bacterium]